MSRVSIFKIPKSRIFYYIIFCFKDIRSFFTVLPKKGSNKESLKNKQTKKAIIQSDDEDVVPKTPQKKRKMVVLSSDSDEDREQKPKASKQKKKDESPKKLLKPCNNLKDAFGTDPVKQKKSGNKKTQIVKEDTKTELGIHDDSSFEKILMDLDDELLEKNADILDKTVEEALASNGESSKKNDCVKGSLAML